MIDLVSPDFWPIVPLVPHWGISHFIWRFMDPHGLARSSSFKGCSLRCGRDRYLTEPLETHPARSALLDTWMPSCFSIREVHPGSMCMIQLWIWMTNITCSTIDDFMSLCSSDLSYTWCHAGAYFRSDEIYRSWGSCVLILICKMYAEMMIYLLSSWWFLSGAYRKPSSQAHAFRCLDVVMFPSERRLSDMWVWFSCRHRWFELIWFFDMLHSRCHTGAYSPSWSRFIDPPIDLHDHPPLWDTRQVDGSISFCFDTPRSLSWVVQLDSYSLI